MLLLIVAVFMAAAVAQQFDPLPITGGVVRFVLALRRLSLDTHSVIFTD